MKIRKPALGRPPKVRAMLRGLAQGDFGLIRPLAAVTATARAHALRRCLANPECLDLVGEHLPIDAELLRRMRRGAPALRGHWRRWLEVIAQDLAQEINANPEAWGLGRGRRRPRRLRVLRVVRPAWPERASRRYSHAHPAPWWSARRPPGGAP